MTNKQAIEHLEHFENLNCCVKEDREAIQCAVEALKKRVPTKPMRKPKDWGVFREYNVCPYCEKAVVAATFCDYCGQALDWGD